MPYKIEIDHEEEGWKVIKRNSIETEDGLEDETLAVFYNQHLAQIFVDTMNELDKKM